MQFNIDEDRGDYPAALALHRQSLAMRRKVFSREHPMTLTALANVARVSLQVAGARSFLARARGPYDVAVFSLAQAYRPISAGRLASWG